MLMYYEVDGGHETLQKLSQTNSSLKYLRDSEPLQGL